MLDDLLFIICVVIITIGCVFIYISEESNKKEYPTKMEFIAKEIHVETDPRTGKSKITLKGVENK